MERIYALVVNRHRVLLAALFLATAFFGWHASAIRFDGSVESLLPGDDPGIRYYAGVRETFGSDEVGVVGVLADDVLAKPVLETIARLTQAIEALDGVEKVVSLTNARDPVLDVIEPPLLVAEFPTRPAAVEELRATLADRPIYRKNLFADDFRAAALNVFFREMSDEEYLATNVDARILEAIEAHRGDLEVHYTGLPHLKTYSVTSMRRDLLRFVPATLALILAVLAASFRSVRGIVLPALTVLLSLTWTLGAMSLAGVGLSLGTVALPPLVLVLGTAYSVHVVAEYYELAGTGRDRREVVLEMLRRTGFPLVIAAATTIAGFASLGVNSIQSIRQMGIFSSLGIFLAFLFSLLLVPSLLLVLPLRAGRGHEPGAPGWLERALETVGRFSIRNRRLIAIIAAGIALACVSPIARIQVDSNFLSFFEEDDPIRLATDAINRRLVGATAFYVVVDGTEAGTFKKWESLKRLKDFQQAVDRLPGVERTISFVDYAEMLDRGSQSSTSGEIVVGPDGEIVETPAPVEITSFWQKPERIGAVLSLVASSPDTFSSVVSPDFRRANLIVRTSLAQSSEINQAADRIAEIGRRTFPADLQVHPTGNLLLLTKTTGDIVLGQAQSLALTAGVIFAVMSAMFLSMRVGVIAMVPNLFPILVFFALLGLSGAALNFGTNIIASIALGVGVDETIHLMSRLSAEVRATGNQERALLGTLTTVGKPALYASSLLFLGFLVLCLSTFVPIQEFGWLSAVTVTIGTGSELLLLPALLATTKIITLWDVLYLKLGPEPHRTIPLFASLRPTQAKIVALMASLRSYPAGTPVVRQGEVGQEMFVIINGRADVFVNVNGHAQRVRGLGRGDVFGEMGLIRRHERTADVISTQDLEVMAMNEQMLTRVQRRYPRTANKILVNLARILSDRLQDETQRAASRSGRPP